MIDPLKSLVAEVLSEDSSKLSIIFGRMTKLVDENIKLTKDLEKISAKIKENGKKLDAEYDKYSKLTWDWTGSESETAHDKMLSILQRDPSRNN